MVFLDELERIEDDPTVPTQSIRQTVTFYLKGDKKSDKGDHKPETLDGLKKIEIVLEAFAHKNMAGSMRQSLAKLFDACSIVHSLNSTSQQNAIPKKRFAAVQATLVGFY